MVIPFMGDGNKGVENEVQKKRKPRTSEDGQGFQEKSLAVAEEIAAVGYLLSMEPASPIERPLIETLNWCYRPRDIGPLMLSGRFRLSTDDQIFEITDAILPNPVIRSSKGPTAAIRFSRSLSRKGEPDSIKPCLEPSI